MQQHGRAQGGSQQVNASTICNFHFAIFNLQFLCILNLRFPYPRLCQLSQILSQLWRDSAANQRIASFPLGGRRKLNQESGPAGFEQGYRLTVPEQDSVGWQGRDSAARRKDSDQVQRISGADRDQLARFWSSPNGSQQSNRFRQRKLLSRKPADESTAANFTARFQLAVDHQQLAPRRSQSFAIEQLAHHDSIAAQQRVRNFFNVQLS